MKFKDTKYGDLTGQHYEGAIDVSQLGLTSLEGSPLTVSSMFDCAGNNLTSLKDCPKMVGGNFACQGNQLTSLEGCPAEVGKSMFCSYNKLTSLDNGPKKVVENFWCQHNKITTLKGFRTVVGGEFNAHENQNPYLEKEWRLRKENPTANENEINKMMYKLTKDTMYLPDIIKKTFLIKDKK